MVPATQKYVQEEREPGTDLFGEPTSIFNTRQVEVPTQLGLENHEKTISCQWKLDRKIITFSQTF